MIVEEKKIYLLLTDTGTLLTQLIKLYTKRPYNHASIAFNSDLSEVYSFGRKTPRNPLIGGFVQENIHSILFNEASCAIYSLTVTKDQFQKMKRYIRKIEVHKEQYRYNFIGLFGVVFNKPVKRKHAFFCSQFVASVLTESNIIDFEKEVSLLEPSDLPYTAEFKLIYEGRLRDYHKTSTDEKYTNPYQFHPIKM